MKVFIFGPAGFPGSAVAAEFAGRGHTVVVMDRERSAPVMPGTGPLGMHGGILEAEELLEGGEIEEIETFVAEEEEEPASTGLPGGADIQYIYGDLKTKGEWQSALAGTDTVISLMKPLGAGEDMTVGGMEEYSERHTEEVTSLINAASRARVRNAVVTYHTLCLCDRKGAWVREADAINPAGICRPLGRSFEAVGRAAREAGVGLVSVFPSMVYGNGGWFRRLVKNLQNGRAKVVEPGDNYLSLIHISDLAGLYAEIVEKVDKADVFTMSDSNPVQTRTFVGFVAGLLGLSPPETVNFHRYASEFGRLEAEAMSASVRVSGERAVSRLGYVMKFPSYQEGVPDILESMGVEIVGMGGKRAA